MNGNGSNTGREEELSMLVGMGFERNTAKRAMEANSWNMDQAINDLTSGEDFQEQPQHTQSARTQRETSDVGLNPLPMPQRRSDDGGDQRRGRKSKKKKKRRRPREEGESSHRERTPGGSSPSNDGDHQIPHIRRDGTSDYQSPARQTERSSQGDRRNRPDIHQPPSPTRQVNTQRISQYDATSDTSPATPIRFMSGESTPVVSLNAPSSQTSKCFDRNVFHHSNEWV